MGEAISSIFRLLEEYEICIPAIQREYVQGSDDKKIQEIRENLLKDIIETLDSEENRLSLGIIYGITDKKLFYPLDGQQRLTTLFLLYWFVAMKDRLPLSGIKFTYEIRYSANSFFRELLNDERKEEFLELLEEKDKDSFIKAIKTKRWFKTQWFNDITVLSVLNTLGEIINLRIDTNKLKIYSTKLTQKENCPIFFYFLREIDENDPYKNSSKNYIRINSRGKMLENFENIKARIEIIERTLKKSYNKSQYFDETKLFTWKYDTEYIDLFYDRVQKKDLEFLLEEKTKIINDETVNILTNLYNILVFSNENESLKLKQCVNKEYFYSVIYKISKNGFVGDKKESLEKFGEEYFEFIDIVINSINKEKKIMIYIEGLFQNVNEYTDKNEQNNILLAYVKYIYYYFKKHKNYVGKENLSQLEYVLTNLKYQKWKVQKFCFNDKIIKDMAQTKDIYNYFLAKDYMQIEHDFGLRSNSVGINDIKVRFKEQSIKFKIINEINKSGNEEKYDYFKDLENLSDKRTIHFLISISGMWNGNISGEKVKVLLSYMKIAEVFFCSVTNILIWRKILAVVSNTINGKLCCNEDVKRRANKYIDGKNSWYWNDNFYHIDDKINDNSDGMLKFKSKMQLVKDAYDFVIRTGIVNITNQNNQLNENKFITWCKDNFNSSYNTCWLKYAIDRNHEELLLNKLSYNENRKTVYIEVSNDSIEINQEVNFFARVFFWDKIKEGDLQFNRYFTSVWDYQSRRVSSKINHIGIKVTDLTKPLINQFAPKLLWFSKREEYLVDDKYRYRYFFYCSYNVIVPDIENSVFLIEKNKLTIFKFIENFQYDEHKYELDKSSKKQQVDIIFKEFNELVTKYVKRSDFQYDKWDVYDYTYNNEWIHKCGYKTNGDIIKFSEFKTTKKGSLDFKIL